MAMNMSSYLQQQSVLGLGLIEAPPGLDQAMLDKFSRSGSKAFAHLASEASTAASSPERQRMPRSPDRQRKPPGVWRNESNTSSSPSTPQDDWTPDMGISLDEQSQAFNMELFWRTSQLQQQAFQNCFGSPFPETDGTSALRYESFSPSRSPRRKHPSEQKLSLPLSDLVGVETYAVPDAFDELDSESPTRGRSPKKNKKRSKKQLAVLDPELEGLPSRGSKNHEKGQCRPCRDFHTAAGCANGIFCNFCHCDHGEASFCLECDMNDPGEAQQDGIPQAAEKPSFRPPPGLLPPPGL